MRGGCSDLVKFIAFCCENNLIGWKLGLRIKFTFKNLKFVGDPIIQYKNGWWKRKERKS